MKSGAKEHARTIVKRWGITRAAHVAQWNATHGEPRVRPYWSEVLAAVREEAARLTVAQGYSFD